MLNDHTNLILLIIPIKTINLIYLDSHHPTSNYTCRYQKHGPDQIKMSNTRARNLFLNWIKFSNKEMCKWARDYLVKKGCYTDIILSQNEASIIKQFDLYLEQIDIDISDVEKVEKMKRSWLQHKRRKKLKQRKLKEMSITIELEHYKKIKTLSKTKGITVNDCIEQCIDESYNDEKIKKLYQYIDRLSRDRDELMLYKKHNRELERELKDTKRVNKELLQLMNEKLRKIQ